jgi:hypothetical protein
MRNKKSITLQSRQVFKYIIDHHNVMAEEQPAFRKTTKGEGGGKGIAGRTSAESSRRSERRLLLLNSGHGGSGSGMTLLGSAQHQCLIDLAKAGSLVLCLLEPRLELLLCHLQVLDVSGGAVQERNLAGLLVGDGKSILEATVAVPELITSPLLRLDALATDFLAADLIRSSGGAGGGEVIIIVREVIMLAGAALALATRACNGGDADRVVANGAGNRGKVGRVGARAAAGATRGAVRGYLAGAQGHQGSRVNAVRRAVGTTGGASRIRAAVGVLGHRSGKVQTWEAQTGRRMDGGHAERFGVGILEIIEASQGVVGEAGGCGVDEVGTLGVLKNLLEGTFHCGCG